MADVGQQVNNTSYIIMTEMEHSQVAVSSPILFPMPGDKSLEANSASGANRSKGSAGQNGKVILNHQCLFCDKCFSSILKLESHMNVHTKERPYFCNYCNDAFSSNNVRWVHEKIHLGRPQYKCDVCEKMFTSPSTLYSHRKRDHKGMTSLPGNLRRGGGKQRRIAIVARKSSVGQMISTKKKLGKKKKIKKQINNIINTSTISSSATSNQSTISAAAVAATVEISSSFQVTDNQQHFEQFVQPLILTDSHQQAQVSSPSPPSNPSPIFNNNHHHLINNNNEISTSDNNSLQIKSSVEQQSSPTINGSTINKKVGRHSQTLTCKSCPKTFSNESALNLHVMRKHGTIDQRPYRCQPCDKAYCTMAELNRHNVRIHNSKSNPGGTVVCIGESQKKSATTTKSVANKNASNRKGQKKSSKKTNTNSAVGGSGQQKAASASGNTCQFCQESFNSQRRLKLHMTVEHGHLNVTSYQCECCQKGFYSAEELKSHVCIYQRPQWADFHLQSPDSSIIKIQNVTMDSVLDRQLLQIICE